MDRQLCVQKKRGTRGTKQAKRKKKSIKIVYISNPLKVKTSPSEFMSLVQELTGQDSDVADFTKFTEINGGDVLRSVPLDDEFSAVRPELSSVESDHHQSSTSVDSSFELFNDVFAPQMLQILTGFLASGNSEAQGDLVRSLDAV